MPTKRHPNKDVRNLLSLCAEQGATIKPTRHGFAVYPADSIMRLVIIHMTSSDRRALTNIKNDLRNSGFQL